MNQLTSRDRAVHTNPTYAAVAAVCGIFAIVGCYRGPSPLTARLDRAVEAHELIDELIVQWASPSAVDHLSDGRLVYTWKRPWTGSAVNYAVPYGQAYAVQHVCTIVVQTTPEGHVERYRYFDC